MIKAKDCDGHSVVILQFWYHLPDDLISADFLIGQKGFCFSISAYQYGMCSSVDEGYLTAQTLAFSQFTHPLYFSGQAQTTWSVFYWEKLAGFRK